MRDNVFAKIADSELHILRLLWDEGRPMRMTEIRKALSQSMSWDGSTIKTLVYRLVDKGALLSEKKKTAVYSPLVSEQEYSKFATGVLIDKLYGGSAKNLVTALVNTKTLDDADITELRSIFKVGE